MFTQSAVQASRAAATHTVESQHSTQKIRNIAAAAAAGQAAVPPPTLVLATIGD